MKPVETNYPVYNTGLLAMRYALIKSRENLLGERTFALDKNYSPLGTAMKSPPCINGWHGDFSSFPSITLSCTKI